MDKQLSIWTWVDRLASISLIAAVLVVGLSVLRRQGGLQATHPTAPAAIQDISETTTLAGAVALGSADAKLVLIEFTDYQCPFCAKHAQETYPRMREEFVDSGRAVYAVRNLPLTGVHPFAHKAAEAVECSNTHGRYWDLRDRLFAAQDRLGLPDLIGHAVALGIEASAFEGCLDGRMSQRIESDGNEAKRLGARSTPTFFVGVRNPDGGVMLVKKIIGAQPMEVFRRVVAEVSSTL